MKDDFKFKTDPFDHQREVFLASRDKEFFALLLDRGTGKTKVALDNIGYLYLKGKISAALIISLNGVHRQWSEEQIPLHLPCDDYISRVWTGGTSKKYKASLEQMFLEQNKLKILTMNVESFQSSTRARALAVNFLKAFPTLLVIDESTTIKNMQAKRTKFIVNRLGPLAVYRRILTGNEITKSPFDVFSQFKFLSHDFWSRRGLPNFHIFQRRYGQFEKNFTFIKGRRIEYDSLLNYKNMEELRAAVMSNSSRVMKEDCVDLPPQIFQNLYVDLNSEQKRIYSELKEKLIAEYQGVTTTVIQKMTLFMRFQQIVGGFFPETDEPIGKRNPKIDVMLADIEELDPQPIIIWAAFRAEIQAIARALEEKFPDRRTALYYGDTSKDERSRIKTDFAAGRYHFFVANPAVGGTGLNLQASCIQYNFSFSSQIENTWQAIDRTHRIGQTKTCIYKTLYCPKTVDDIIQRSQREKTSLALFFKSSDPWS